MKNKSLNAIMEDVTKDIYKYGDTKKVLMGIKECDDESIMYKYSYDGDLKKYELPRQEEDGWTYHTVSLGYLDMCLRGEKDSRKEKFTVVGN